MSVDLSEVKTSVIPGSGVVERRLRRRWWFRVGAVKLDAESATAPQRRGCRPNDAAGVLGRV